MMEAHPDNSIDHFEQIPEQRVRRPPNAFMIFGQQYRKVLAKKFNTLSNKEISKLLGDEWKKMDGVHKQHYHDLSKQAYSDHLNKYPNYHYNPLEARQRKAERKRKYRTVGQRVSHRSKANSLPECVVIRPFGGNRTNSTLSSTVHYIQPIIDGQTAGCVIGLKKPFGQQNPLTEAVVPIAHIEHNYAIQPKSERQIAESFTYEANCLTYVGDYGQYQVRSDYETHCYPTIEVKENEIPFGQQSAQWNEAFDLLANFLPPMDNPNAVTPIFVPTDDQMMGSVKSEDFNSSMDEKPDMADNEFIVGQNDRTDVEAMGPDGDHCPVGDVKVGQLDIPMDIETSGADVRDQHYPIQ